MWERRRWTFFNRDTREMLRDVQSVWRAGETIVEVLMMRETEPGICLRIVRIKLYRARHVRDELIKYLARPLATKYQLSAAQEKVMGL